MKYAREWNTKIKTIPFRYGENSLHYKKWKKMTKMYDDDFLAKIEYECDSIDRFYKKQMKSLFDVGIGANEAGCLFDLFKLMRFYDIDRLEEKTCLGLKGVESFLDMCRRADRRNGGGKREIDSPCFPCSPCSPCPTQEMDRHQNGVLKTQHESRVEASSWLIDFLHLNRRSLYKICKRFDKHSGLQDVYTIWYKEIAKKKYTFLKNDMSYAFITWKSTSMKETCPICLEDDYGDFVFQKCGHVICAECIKTMASVNRKQDVGVRGTLENIIRNLQYYQSCDCPLCRCPKALSEFKIARS